MYNVLRKNEGARQLWKAKVFEKMLKRLHGGPPKPSKLLQTLLLETMNHQTSLLLRLPRSLRFRVYDFVLDVPYDGVHLWVWDRKGETRINWDLDETYAVTRACRQLRKETHPLFLEATRRLWFQFDYMPVTRDLVWHALKDFLPYIQGLQVSFFPHLSRLLALLPSLQWVHIETEDTFYVDLWVPWKEFEELAFEGDERALELGDRILERFGQYENVDIIIDFSVVTTRHEEMYHITSEEDGFRNVKWHSGPMDKLEFSLDLRDRILLWKQFGTTGGGLLCFGHQWENEYWEKITFEYFIAKIAPEDQQLGFRPTEYDFPKPIDWNLPLN